MVDRKRDRDRTKDRGFTLIEVLTAMMILAISMVTIFQLFSDGLKGAKLSNEYTQAIFFAKAKMEDVLLADGLAEGETEGMITEGIQWRLRIVPFENEMDSMPPPRRPLTQLFQVSVDIAWGVGEHQRTFTLSTLHLALPIAIKEDQNA